MSKGQKTKPSTVLDPSLVEAAADLGVDVSEAGDSYEALLLIVGEASEQLRQIKKRVERLEALLAK